MTHPQSIPAAPKENSMTNPKHLFGPLARTARLAAVAACSLALITACGGSGDDTAELKTPAELAKELQGAENGDGNNGDSCGAHARFSPPGVTGSMLAALPRRGPHAGFKKPSRTTGGTGLTHMRAAA